jgi:FlaA1/EpsC-like NDP-sugar epimerase
MQTFFYLSVITSVNCKPSKRETKFRSIEILIQSGFADLYIYNYFSSRIGDGLHKLDLTDENEVKKAVMQFKPRFLIHCAAQRFPEKVDLDPKSAAKINVDASRYLAQVAGMNTLFTVEIQYTSKQFVSCCLSPF